MTHAVNMARNVAAEVARGRHKGSNPYAELILKLAWGPNFLSPGTRRFGLPNNELLSNWLGGRVSLSEEILRVFCFYFSLSWSQRERKMYFSALWLVHTSFWVFSQARFTRGHGQCTICLAFEISLVVLSLTRNWWGICVARRNSCPKSHRHFPQRSLDVRKRVL